MLIFIDSTLQILILDIFLNFFYQCSRYWCVRLVLSEQVLAQWRHLVAFLKALDLLHRAMRFILYRHIAMAIEMKSKVGTFCMVVLLLVALAAARAIRSK